jgi:hypothetical protein
MKNLMGPLKNDLDSQLLSITNRLEYIERNVKEVKEEDHVSKLF